MCSISVSGKALPPDPPDDEKPPRARRTYFSLYPADNKRISEHARRRGCRRSEALRDLVIVGSSAPSLVMKAIHANALLASSLLETVAKLVHGGEAGEKLARAKKLLDGIEEESG